MTPRARYGTWIRVRLITRFWLATAVFLLLAAAAPLSPWFLLAIVPAALTGYIAVIITWTHRRFSPAGGDYQRRIHHLLLSLLDAPATILDIGCGSGALIIGAARRHPDARCLGVDDWGRDWEYSLAQCRDNARAEGTPAVEFRRGDAARLDLAADAFAAVLSCLTFHEVRQAPDKLAVVQEALRVVAPGGRFVFLDLFDDPTVYPPHADLLAAIVAAGGRLDTDRTLASLIPLPYPLATRKVLQYARVIAGIKTRD